MQVLSARGKRSFTYSFIILAVISIFVLGYLLYFVPHNKKTIQNNGFLILSTIAANIEDAVESRVALPVNVYKNLKGLEKERRKEIVDAFQNGNISGSKINIIRTKDTLTGTQLVTNIQFVDGQLKVSVFGPGETEGILYSESIQNFLDQFISTQKKELFHSYIFGTLRSPKSEVLYHDEDLPIRSDIGLDSLMPKMGTDFLAGTRNVISQEEEQKMFYYPFNIRDKQFIICGFVDSDTYQSDLRKIPFYFIYPLVIAFLLLVISLPILKFYIMDSNEQVRVNDVLFFGVSVFLGAAFITLIIIQFLLWKGEENRVAKNLVSLADQIKNRFGDEVRKAYGEMQVLDSLIKEQKPPANADSSETIRKYLIAHNLDPNYYYFDRISWIDDTGNQIIKGELKSQPVFTKVDKRNYFKLFSQGVPYYLPGDSTRRFGWEAINSVTNGGFNFTISMQGKEYVAAMATRMYSLLNVIMPVGYGYCIINDSGVVQVHSDENRNLNENFFKKIAPADQIKGAVASRQSRIVNDVVAYGKLQMIAVEPLHASMPFHIVTFYEKGHIIPVNMRILVFTLLLCGLITLTCALLWWVIGWKNPKNNPLLFCSMDFLTWIMPKSEEGTYYFHGSFYLSVYFFAILGYMAINGPYDPNNFSILALVMVTPVNIVFGLYCIRAAFTLPLSNRHWDELDKKRHEVLIYAALHLLISVIIFISVQSQFSIDNGFLVFQLVVNAIMWIYALASGRSRLVTYRSRRPFLFGYKFLLTALVVCLAVLPSSLITWYAHNQELIQSTKRQQLHLAKAIQDRSFGIVQMKGASDSELLPDYYLDSLQFSGGIYKIQGDRISYDTCKVAENDVKTFDNFYFSLAEKLSIPYYDEQSYAGLEDNAKDSTWRWKRDADMNMNIWYQPSFPSRNFSPRDPRKCLHIVSTIPPRFVYLRGSATPVWLVILVLLLLFGLFQWLGRNTERIFLSRYVYSTRLRKVDENEGLIAEYFAGKETTGDEATLRLHSSSRYKDYHIHCEKKKLLEYEEEIVTDLTNGKEFYEYVWAHCTDKEKYLLFDYSEDGLINYKNTKEIIELINKGIFIVYEERLRIFSPGFRAFILNSVDRTEIYGIQKKYKANSTWQYVKVPLLILLCGIAAILFFTQQGVFNNLLLLAGGVSTLLGLVMRFFGGGGGGGNGKKD